ncbi:MAG: fibrobacter succinogenes major paralogous domain-containing protein, partial [Bacteroidales bacterium]|nr:fibrobacter succinogenes major paralogous domain-containing protein [Bacteroidales bacterium]
GYISGYTETDPQYNAWDKDYNDLINKPVIPVVPTNVSAFTNDAGYITLNQVPAQVNADWTATSGAALILNKPTLFSGNYDDLTNKPTLFDGNYNSLSNKPNLSAVAISGSYNDLINKPSIPTAVGELTNNVGYITLAQVPAQVNADWNASTGAAQILNKPTIPTVPTNVSAFTNDAGYVTAADVQQAAGVPTNVSAFNNDMGYLTSYTETDPLFTAWGKNYNTLNNKPNLATVATSGNYNDLSNRPTIPTNVSAFTNDAGYITASQVPAQVNADWNATSGAAKILNKPSNVSVFNNDAHYITEAELNALLAAVNNTIDSLRDRIEELENGESPVNPDPVNPDTTVTPGTPVNIDGLACPGTATITDWDGNVYNTVAIGQQCWMKENLRTTKYADGQSIASATTGTSTTARYRYYPGNNSSNLETYGFVYNWPAVMYGSTSSNTNPSNVRGICPTGWHVPSNQEWTQLRTYVSSQMDNRCDGNSQNIAKALASTSNWTSNSISCTVGDYAPNNNTTGFSALPAGDNTGNVGTYANFWSCTQSDNSIAYAVQLGSTSTVVTVNADADKSSGYSVRCVRDSAITSGVAQMVVTDNVSGVTTNSASCGGTVNSSNGLQVNERGVCWSQMPNPNVDGDHTPSGSGSGSFTVSITGLQPSTTYYVRAYATTNAGTTYGNTQTFTTQNDASACGIASITDYDGNTYNTVKIGDQCWMKENLRTTHYADGTTISSNYGTSAHDPFYYIPSGTSAYGYLYNGAAMMHGASTTSSNPSNVRGICPIGWHVPSNGEWSQLLQYVSDQIQYRCASDMTYIAKSLASNTGWNSSTNTCAVGNELSTNNNTGFSALPAGFFYNNTYGGFYEGGETASFWNASGSRYRISYNNATVNSASTGGGIYSGNCYSVRCLRD